MTRAELEIAGDKLAKAGGLFMDDTELELVFDLPLGTIGENPELREIRDRSTAKAKARLRQKIWEKAMADDDNSALRMAWASAEKIVFEPEDEQ
jgi:hypothetical protein